MDNFPIFGGSQSAGDLYGSAAGGDLSAVAPAAVQASAGGPSVSSGNGPAWSWVGFVLLIVALRVVIELGGEVD